MPEHPRAELDTVLGKAVLLLRAFSAEDHVLSLAELVRRTGLPKATVYRVTGDLVSHRLLARVNGGYQLGRGLFELGMRAAVERTLLEIAMPFLQDLYERTHETVHLGVLDGHEVVYVAKIGGHRQAASPSRTGGRMPLHCTAIGKALLAHVAPSLRREVLAVPLERRTPHTVVAPGLLDRQLHAIRENGVSFEREESRTGLVCIASPILDRQEPKSAVSVAGPVGRFRPESQVAALQAATQGIANVLARRTEDAT